MSVTALVLPVAGPYTGQWNSFAMGTQNDDGFALLGAFTGQEVNASDAYGMTLVEAIYRGINWRVRVRGIEFNKPGMLAALQAFGSSGAPSTTLTPTLGAIGTRSSVYAQALTLSAILSTTFVQTLTALGAIPAPNTNMEHLMTSKVREAPLEFALLPYSAVAGSLTVNVAFTTT